MRPGMVVGGILAAAISLIAGAPPASPTVTSVQHAQFGAEAGHDYGPAVIRDGDIERRFWCGIDFTANPAAGTPSREVIYYSSVNLATGAVTPRQIALPPENSNWDRYLVCDPSVLKGPFTYAQQTWQYALYYTSNRYAGANGRDNAIGAAFSNNLVNWIRTPAPVVVPEAPGDGTDSTPYGAGNPSVIRMPNGTFQMYYSDNSSGTAKTFVQTSTNGYVFSNRRQISNAGLRENIDDISYDAASDSYYTLARTGTVKRLGSEDGAVDVARISRSALETANGVWTVLGQINTDVTLTALNHNPGMLRDTNGRIATLPILQVFLGQTPRGALDDTDIEHSSIGYVQWREGSVTVRRFRALSGPASWMSSASPTPTPGYVFDNQSFSVQSVPGAGLAGLFACRVATPGSRDFFLSRVEGCEGQYEIGRVGYIYTQAAPVGQPARSPLYRCYLSAAHLITTSPSCEGSGVAPESQLGWVTAP